MLVTLASNIPRASLVAYVYVQNAEATQTHDNVTINYLADFIYIIGKFKASFQCMISKKHY